LEIAPATESTEVTEKNRALGNQQGTACVEIWPQVLFSVASVTSVALLTVLRSLKHNVPLRRPWITTSNIISIIRKNAKSESNARRSENGKMKRFRAESIPLGSS
jgi:hypothetical protein